MILMVMLCSSLMCWQPKPINISGTKSNLRMNIILREINQLFIWWLSCGLITGFFIDTDPDQANSNSNGRRDCLLQEKYKAPAMANAVRVCPDGKAL